VAGAVNLLKASWTTFILLILFALYFLSYSASSLPATVAAHFNAAGYPDAFMNRSTYTRLTLAFGVGLPVGLVTLLTLVYSRARDLKLPNRDHWLAPHRSARTRALLVAHSVWFGSLLVSLVCFVHWLVLGAQHRVPPRLSNPMFYAGLVAFFLITSVWMAVLLLTLRRPRGAG
jgi:uncharacterized membrane protein